MRLLLAPALGVLTIFAVALGALFQYSVVAFIPGSLQTGGLTLANFRSVISPQYLGYVWDTVVYRPDLVKEDITRWSDLWKPSLKGKIALPDFDPSHIITIAALMEGGNELTWEKGQERLRQLKPSIVAFYSTDAQSQDLMKTGQAPVQVMLTVNAYHLQEQSIAIKLVQPADYPGIVGIDTMAVMAGTKRADAAHQFINMVLSKEIQSQLVESLRAGPVNVGAAVPAKLKGQPGIFTTPAEWKERGYIMNDEARAKTLPAWREWFTANIVKK